MGRGQLPVLRWSGVPALLLLSRQLCDPPFDLIYAGGRRQREVNKPAWGACEQGTRSCPSPDRRPAHGALRRRSASGSQ